MAKRPKPNRLFIVVTSDPPGLVDMHITLERGGQLKLSLNDGPEDEKPFRFNLPAHLPRDQQKFVIDSKGMRTA